MASEGSLMAQPKEKEGLKASINHCRLDGVLAGIACPANGTSFSLPLRRVAFPWWTPFVECHPQTQSLGCSPPLPSSQHITLAKGVEVTNGEYAMYLLGQFKPKYSAAAAVALLRLYLFIYSVALSWFYYALHCFC